MAALAMIVGNLTALRQTNIKRMLAYSSIAHVRLPAHGTGSPHRTRPGRHDVLSVLCTCS